MKKLLGLLSMLCLLMCLSTGSALADSPIRVYLNGEALSFDVAPQIIDGYTMVPMRKIFEAMGYDVYWNNYSKTVYARSPQGVIKMTVGQKSVVKNGATVSTVAAPQIINGRTLVPLRAVSDSSGYTIDWNGNTKTVTIYKESKPASSRVEDILVGDFSSIAGTWKSQNGGYPTIFTSYGMHEDDYEACEVDGVTKNSNGSYGWNICEVGQDGTAQGGGCRYTYYPIGVDISIVRNLKIGPQLIKSDISKPRIVLEEGLYSIDDAQDYIYYRQ